MAQVVFNHVGGKPPFFDGICYDYWKRKMIMYLGSINDQVWEVTENDYAIIDPDDPTNQDKINKQCNTMALNTRHEASGGARGALAPPTHPAHVEPP